MEFRIGQLKPLLIHIPLLIAIILAPRQAQIATPTRLYKPAAVTQSIKRAADYLVKQQIEGIGAFGNKDRLALTSMATLALLSTGSTPRRGPYAQNITRAVRWVLSKQRSRGHFWDSTNDYSDIHNHGYALLLLTQVYGECGPALDAQIARAIPRALKASEESQHRNGGFGYYLYRQPPANATMMTADEASTTISQIQAFRGARNAGFTINNRRLQMAESYINRSQHKSTGGFVYSLKLGKVSFNENSNTPTFAITAACSCVLNSLGTYRGASLNRAIDYIEKFRPKTKESVYFYYYGHYYAAQVFHQIGGSRGTRWRKAILDDLLARQSKNGEFPHNSDSHVQGTEGAILNTSWALQIMTLDRSALPIFER